MAFTPKPPSTPRVRTMRDVSACLEVVPYFLEGDPEIIKEATNQGKLRDLYGDDEFTAVGVGHLKMRHYIEYERIHGITIEQVVNRLLWVFWAVSKIARPDMDALEVPVLNEHDNMLETPFGTMVGSVSMNMAEFLGWALSRRGRIIGVKENGDFEYEAIEPVEIIDMLDPKSLMLVDEDGTPLFFEILALTGLYSAKDAQSKDMLDEGAEAGQPVEDDGAGNSRSRSRGGGSTSATSTQRKRRGG